MKRILNNVPIRTDASGVFCARDCPLLVYVSGTCCALESAKAARGTLCTRYDRDAEMYRRCPACRRLEAV